MEGLPTFDEELDWHFALSPLHSAAQGNSVEAARCLLAHGAKLDACSFEKRTPLFYAAARGSAGVAKVLLEAGADPNVREERKPYSSLLDYTPLHYAASNGHADAVKVLLAFGADPTARESNQKKTPRELAQSARHHSVIAVLDDPPPAGQLRLFP